MTLLALTERRPTRGNWERAPLRFPFLTSAWRCGPVTVISALENAEYPDGVGAGPQWHISVTRRGQRPGAADVERALRAFRMVGTEEDNHHPGSARHFWLPVDPSKRVDCQCKSDEEVIVEADGYTWTNPRPETGEECRGCEFGRRFAARPCPLHAEVSP